MQRCVSFLKKIKPLAHRKAKERALGAHSGGGQVGVGMCISSCVLACVLAQGAGAVSMVVTLLTNPLECAFFP